MSQTKLDILSINGSSVYIEERDTMYNLFLDCWVAPVNKDGSIDHKNWTAISDTELDWYFDRKKVKVGSISVDVFKLILNKPKKKLYGYFNHIVPKLNKLAAKYE